MDDNHPDPNQYWFHRRTMAYISLACIVLSLMAAIAGVIDDAMAPLVEGLSWVFGFVLLNYYGNNALEAFAKARK